MTERHYASPAALRAAITDRLRTAAAEHPDRSLPDLQRQFAYDRLLYRVFTGDDAERWVLKGATALLARLRGEARHSVDIDLYDRTGTLDDAEAALRAATARDVGDHFRFVLGLGRRIAEAGVALRVNATAFLGAREFARFNVDVVVGTAMTGIPGEAGPLVPIEVPGVPRARYRIYPLADHVADKILAILERHARQDGRAIDSTRYRDLADLVVIARREVLEADALMVATRVQADRRRLDLPRVFRPPDAPGWRTGYARVARDVPRLEEKELDAAIATAGRFLDPVLQATARGRWAPDRQRWVDVQKPARARSA